jgi:hypothetical protein
MKSFATMIVAAVLSAALVGSSALPELALMRRAQCKSPSGCSWFNSGQCEHWCGGHELFSHMQGCGWLRKRCCCTS